MKEELQNILNENSYRLVNELYIDVVFLSKLVSAGTIKASQKSEIDAKPTNSEKVGKLIEILLVSPNSCFESFLKHLEKANKDLYDLIFEDWKKIPSGSGTDPTPTKPGPQPGPAENLPIPSDRKYFLIGTGLQNNTMVLGVENNQCIPGAKVVLSKRTRGILWYRHDDDDHICSKENDLVLDGDGNAFRVNRYTGGAKQLWVFDDIHIANMNNNDEVMELKKACEVVGTEVWRQTKNSSKRTQQWIQVNNI